MSGAEETIDRLKARLGVSTDTDLADRLLVSRSTVANWRNRERVPDRYARIARGEAVPGVWGDEWGSWSELDRAAMLLALMRLIRDFSMVGASYEGFLTKGYEAALELQPYHAKAVTDIFAEMQKWPKPDEGSIARLLAMREFHGAP